MTAWDESRSIFERLLAEHDDAFIGYPDPSGIAEGEPFEVQLEAFAVDVAARLHERFGSGVKLLVGVMRYPSVQLIDPRESQPVPSSPPLEQAGLHLTPVEPLVVGSGHPAELHFLLANRSGTDRLLVGRPDASVHDPHTGQRVGADFRPIVASLPMRELARNSEIRIQVPVGTMSVVPELGYAVHAGEWHLRVRLGLDNRSSLQSEPLPLTITT